MANNPLELAIRSAIKANDEIGASFARLGTSEHPRGFVLSAYRNANRALRQALTEQNRMQAAIEVLAGLKSRLRADLRVELESMAVFGQEEALRQMGFFGESLSEALPLFEQIESAVTAIMARADAQDAAIRAMLASGINDDEITGGDERAGVLRANEILTAAAFWISKLVWSSFEYQARISSWTFSKQAVAALDGKTTDCCLRVHGQIQEWGKPFKLTGTPRFADEMDWPGFHWWCRTSGVLYLPEFDDGLTARMKAGARWFLQQRAEGKNPDRRPADAFG